MQAVGELASHITQASIVMVSLPVHVAALQEAACLREENINHLDSSYTVWQILPLKLTQRQQTHIQNQSRSMRFKLHIMNIFWSHLNDFGSHNLDATLHFTLI